MTTANKTLRKLLKRASVAELISQPAYRDVVVTDAHGEILLGAANQQRGPPAQIKDHKEAIGWVYGSRAADLAAMLSAVAELSAETHALAAESLDKYRELAMLYNVSEKVLAAPDVAQVAALICNQAQRSLRGDSVSVLLVNDETGRLELVQTCGSAYHSRASIEAGDDLVGDVLRSGTGEIVNDVAADSRPRYADNRLHSIACSPLKSRGRTFGVVVVGSESPRDYTAGDLQLLNALASQAAAAIDVARLYGALKRSSAKPADLIYGLNDRPPTGALVVLGIQHVFIASISLVVPLMIALEAGMTRSGMASLVGMSLIAMGIVTLLQARQFGPVGSGYLAPQIASAIYLPPSLLAVHSGGLGLVFGMTFLAGIFGLMLSQIIGRVRKLFPPEVCGVVVLMVGFSLIRVALPRFLGLEGDNAAPDRAALLVGIITLATMIAVSITTFGQIRLYSAIIGLLVGYAAATLTGVLDLAELRRVVDLPWFGAPSRPAFEWSFSLALLLPFLIATLASDIKLVGLITSTQKTNDASWKRPNMSSVRGGIVADSIGNLSSGFLGGVGTSIGASNIGLAAATGATSRRIALVTGSMFIALAFVPKVTSTIALMPAPVMGAGLLFLACFLVISGLALIASRLLDARRTFVVGLSILAGVGLDLMPDAFSNGPGWANAFLASPLAFATTLAVLLNVLLNIGVAKKALLELVPEQSAPDAVMRFFERNGAVWGARPDVIARVGPAVVEWCEETRLLGPATTLIEVAFDEFRLTVHVRSADQHARRDRPTLDRVVGHLQRRYDCRIKLLDDENGTCARLDFEH